mmetsp:Transcript_9488/g.14288  ORF Transcript_9488/g.14288 Transcript_9488/m.14288 type:complete len:327 (+) Transcript_9488:156-1136(+)
MIASLTLLVTVLMVSPIRPILNHECHDIDREYMMSWTAENYHILLSPLSAPCHSSEHNKSKVLVIIPGTGFQDDREKIVLNNLKIIRKSTPCVEIKCVLYAYKTPLSHIEDEIKRTCEVHTYFHVNYAHYLKSVLPSLVFQAKFTHVLLLLDDAQLPHGYRLQGLVDIMSCNELSVVSPTVVGAIYASTSCPFCCPRLRSTKSRSSPPLSSSPGHRAKVVEMFATLFTTEAWHCWWELLQPGLNSIGWAYDKFLHTHCSTVIPGFQMGIIDSSVVLHTSDRIDYKLPYSNKSSMPWHDRDLWMAAAGWTTEREADVEHFGDPLVWP